MRPVLAHAALKNRQWVVARCPFCGKRHCHGAGPPDGDPREFLGSRLSHCVGDARGGDIYVLVEEEGGRRNDA